MLQTVDAMVLVLDARGQILRINRVCEHLTGFSAEELRSRPIGEVFPVPEEASLFHAILRKLHEGVSLIKYESYLLTKQSESLVVALGNAPQLTYLTAQIAHVTRGSHEERQVYLIGCSYVGRAAY